MGAVVYALPAAAVPVLMGRLAGAFVIGEQAASALTPIQATEPRPAGDAPRITRPTPVATVAAPPRLTRPTPVATVTAPQPPADNLAVYKAARELGGRARTDLAGALAEAEKLRGLHPHHPMLLAALAGLYRQAGNMREAVLAAGQAITDGLVGGAVPVAIEAYTACADNRDKLMLEAPTLERLARALAQLARFDDAAWAWRGAALGEVDPTRVQKGIIGCADGAARAGKETDALAYLEWLLRTWPTSPFRDYCDTTIASLRRKLGLGR
jgi:tetratricopeptide (TPR) repeat protein